jgi:TPR repeat protein
MGIAFSKGLGVERDEKNAAMWLRRAAEGVPEAQYAYGRMQREPAWLPTSRRRARGSRGRSNPV